MYKTHHPFRLEKLKKTSARKSFQLMSTRKNSKKLFSNMFKGNNLKKTFSEMKSKLKQLEL